MDSITDMGVFVRVVARGSLSAAGRELGLSPAVVSKRLARLEERLGVQLLTRTTRRLALTEDGALFHERCTAILAEIEQAEAQVKAGRAAPRGILRVAAPISFGRRHLARHLGDFVRLYPDVRVLLNLTSGSAPASTQLTEGDCDLAIRIGEVADSSLIQRKLAPNQRVLCAAPAYLAARGEPVCPEDLSRHNCLVFGDLQSRADVWNFIGREGPVSVRVSGSLKSNDGEVVGVWAEQGLGLAVKATWDIAPLLKSGALKALLPGYKIPGEGIYALYPKSRHLASTIRVFVDFFAERFGPTPYWDEGLG